MLHLASRSPRRRALLARLGVAFDVIDVDVPEVPAAGESAQAYGVRVAHDKARAGLAAVPHTATDALVLAADTEVVLDGRVFGKPADAADAARMLRQLSGRTHEVVCAVALQGRGRSWDAVVVSQVRFADLPEAWIARYVAGGEPMGKAGAYAIQGGGEVFVAHLSGSHSAVMGLPLQVVAQLLETAGVPVMPGEGVGP